MNYNPNPGKGGSAFMNGQLLNVGGDATENGFPGSGSGGGGGGGNGAAGRCIIWIVPPPSIPGLIFLSLFFSS